MPPNARIIRAPIPFMELPNLEDAIAFRRDSQLVIQRTLAHMVDVVPQNRTMAPKNVRSSVLYPPTPQGKHPVLYQVAAIHSNHFVLEAKDFFVFQPDRLELHCIMLDQFSFNIENNTYGYDRTLVSMKDFVWVYDVSPTISAIKEPMACLERARIPRTIALDSNSEYFFRAARFAFVTPAVWTECNLGVVLSITRRGDYVNNFRMALEGAPETVTIRRPLCRFEWPDVREDEILRAYCRKNVSCAVRFSEPPASQEARDRLCNLVRHFFPAHPDEGIVPMEVLKLRPEDEDWLSDRLGEFDNFANAYAQALRRMGKVFSMACAALAAYNAMDDDRRTHRVTATVPSFTAYPIRLQMTLRDMPSQSGWTRHRPVGVWIMDNWIYVKADVETSQFIPETREMRLTLVAQKHYHDIIFHAAMNFGRRANDTTSLRVRVKLARIPSNANPAFETIARMHIGETIRPDSTAALVINTVYGLAQLECLNRDEYRYGLDTDEVTTINVRGRTLQLTDDQRQALALGNGDFPVAGIQAAFGTGKTVVGASIAVRQAQRREQRVVVTASTNTAVAQFTDTILSLDDLGDVGVIRFVAETVAFDDIPRTPVDLHEILKQLGTLHGERMSEKQRAICRRFTSGRLRYEMYKRDRSLQLTEREKTDFVLAEKDVSETLSDMVAMMFLFMNIRIVCITTSSLLNTTDKDGIFEGYLNHFRLLICDEASQVPEPVFMAMASRLPLARHVYIGDTHQLEPYARCSRHANPAIFGARSVIDMLATARAVPVAPLVTTFRAHPALNELPNQLAYNSTLVSGVPSSERRMLLNIMHFPNPSVPFAFIDVRGTSVQSASHSHYNTMEASVCMDLVNNLLQRGISVASIAIVSFYKEQYRQLEDWATVAGVNLSTVDSIQGREKDVVILLTTKTNSDPDASEFLDAPRRMNVALTRCRHGQLVLGHRPSLSRLQSWSQVIQWAAGLNAIIPHTEIPRLF
ncbi:hypothetical protein ANCDUO_17742 [Ancylostoma duodenale]|uniref:DNA2/NAM7 helicase-like C-terminal domain-containing protein n=1 Tax=Ancylostoma duodenale TaxID=51022 RepID=A0A0C2C794_9BILA|nr:hypothetical protein ANCDUO_17742 [Ancylostoma duodenale]